MLVDIIDALRFSSKDDLDYVSEVLIWLKEITYDPPLCEEIDNWFYEHNRCFKCGNKLTFSIQADLHSEVDTRQYEYVPIAKCTHCEWRSDT